MYDIIILTDKRYLNPKETDWYIDQVLLEDKLLQIALQNQGLKVSKKNWDDTNFDWGTTKHAIFRTTWDYFERFEEFFSWIESTKNKTNFINSAKIIKWNIDKHYLKDLSKRGVNIAPTLFIKKGDKTTLSELFKRTKSTEVIIKPAVSGAARNTYRILKDNINSFEDLFQRLVSKEDMLFQEFLNSITSNGEISLIMIGGRHTHAVKKIAKFGDFRVQDDHGGSVEEYNATKEEINFAKKCLRNCPYTPIYARVDIIYDNNNLISLSELELIEPELWFRNNLESADLLAEEISRLLSSKLHLKNHL